MTQLAVVAERYARAIEAEVARAQLEAAGIDCVVSPAADAAEVRVRPEELLAARAILNPKQTAPRRPSAVCPSCRGRNLTPQGRAFWLALAGVLAILTGAAFLVDFIALIGLALLGTGVLVALELTLKDWKCLRCGERWRLKA